MFFVLKDILFSNNNFRSIGMVLLPIPWSVNISFSLKVDSFSKVVIPSLSNALLAGAPSKDKKWSLGFRSSSQIGQIGQSDVLLNLCPCLHFLNTSFVSIFSLNYFSECLLNISDHILGIGEVAD